MLCRTSQRSQIYSAFLQWEAFQPALVIRSTFTTLTIFYRHQAQLNHSPYLGFDNIYSCTHLLRWNSNQQESYWYKWKQTHGPTTQMRLAFNRCHTPACNSIATFVWYTMFTLIPQFALCVLHSKRKKKKAKRSHALVISATDFLQRPLEYSKNSHVPEAQRNIQCCLLNYTLVSVMWHPERCSPHPFIQSKTTLLTF